MNFDLNIFSYFFHAGLVVKCVMLILMGASIFSWAYIFQRVVYLNNTKKSAALFESQFWSGEDLSKLFLDGNKHKTELYGLESIFHAGFKEFQRFRKQAGASLDAVMDNTKRAMHVAQTREQDRMEISLPFLAIVSSIAPYVGLLGTVWGIMTALTALSNVQQATISMVAPGMAEALVATALGLFAAIPAGIAYNRFVNDIGRLMNRFDAFEEEFINILIRQSQPQMAPARAETME